MKFSLQQQVFHNALRQTGKAVSTSNTMPILSGILIEAEEGGNLTMTATDLELGIVMRVEADVDEPGKIVLPGDELGSIVRELPRDSVSVETDEEDYSAHITSLSSEFDLRGFKPDEFPELPDVEEDVRLSLPESIVSDMVNKVKFSCSKRESQPGLTGALLTVSAQSALMVATNTFRMAYYEKEMDLDLEEKYRAIIPAPTLDELSRLLSDDEENEIEIVLDSSHCRFFCGDVTVTSRLIDGKFPNYNQVMPSEFSADVRVDRKKLQNAVKRVETIARLDSNVIELDFSDNTLKIESTASEKGHGRGEVEIEMEGQPQKIKIDASYILDGLKVLDEDDVLLQLIGPVNPLALKNPGSDDYIYLIMPIRPDKEE